MITIVMYHYVRDLKHSRYPGIKGLDIKKFEGQLDYITEHYEVIGLRDIVQAVRHKESLPKNACVLTFDDGFIDHYTHIFPRLDQRGLVGGFFSCASCLEENRVLDVHKIHFILASHPDHPQLLAELFHLLEDYREEYALPTQLELLRKFGQSGRYDPPPTACLKRLLQRGLPMEVRKYLLEGFFRRFVSSDEESFAQELYVDISQLRTMSKHGMEIGGHSYDHNWLETLTAEEQKMQIRRSRDMLARIDPRLAQDWLFSYPHGSYNQTTLELLRQEGAAVGLTYQISLVSDPSRLLELPRINTNDLPFQSQQTPCSWTLRACA